MKETRQQAEDRARSIRDNPPEEIPMPVIVKREHPRTVVKVDRCPTCGARR
jgi:hypothetical protein